ncbi:hypothetical protein AMK01_CH03606 [Rhizobium sp. N6212]|nr:hypothetical protein AMK01_CH03606 [Rhizobium sp. N6212]ANK99064.1 hypothetical protein AMK00_CH03609 [Rhizobium sp. N621]ANL05195.1 hypothetical protein AMJ99_CH03688 [Rhizobium esperanzae]ANL11249.1 hypothetical protein AMJ98_CH03636 [Rhizobium sp. N1341]ANL23321.1 hypothetical protein AMJ96_CH03657 [Rhizobium sp. N113]ANM36035.1 hypothetical protein AMK04_CH03693 [Rhizobium sp. N871]ANM42093.1 hypothetical protein AMK03_CH03639 [Rhizobium sp. N741]
MIETERSVQAGNGASRPASRLNWSQAVIFGIGFILACLLALPGRTATTKYVNDLFVFLDGAHRIARGQVPNVDFHSPLGPLTFYIPAAGYGLSGNMGGAMPAGMAIVVLLLAVIAAEIVGSRMHKAFGLPLAIFLLLIAAAPANPGERIGELTFAMFYNRIGWASLSLLLVMYLPRLPAAGNSKAVDAACASLLVLLMLYTKITYGVVGLAFLLFMLFDRRQIGWVTLALGMIAFSIITIEIIWRGEFNYLADLRLSAKNSGGVLTLTALGHLVRNNLADLLVYLTVALIVLNLTPSYRHLLFVAFCGTTGILLIGQNFQTVGILTLGASAAIITESLFRAKLLSRYGKPRFALPLLVGFLLLPAAIGNTASLAIHAYYAAGGRGKPIPLPAFSEIRLVEMWSAGQYEYFEGYNRTLADASVALSQLMSADERVAVLDFVNPFSAGLGLTPPVGDSVWYHWGRTLGPDDHPAAEEMFADVDLILDPKWPIEIWTGNGLRDLYAHYIARHYVLVRETADWRIYRRKAS